jgi:hypothetical protein
MSVCDYAFRECIRSVIGGITLQVTTVSFVSIDTQPSHHGLLSLCALRSIVSV